MSSHFTPKNPNNQIDQVISAVCNPKYLEGNELHRDAMARIIGELKDDDDHFAETLPILRNQFFLPAGRIQAAAGAARQTTAFNCYVSDTIEDSRMGIFKRLQEAAETMGLGGGDGFDFSTIRPRGAIIKSSGSSASGPISYMKVWDTMCATIASAGNRRGAMMGVLRVDHPDIEEFIDAKREAGTLTNFNISVAVTDKFMDAVRDNNSFDLVFDGVVFKTIKARALWDKIMRSTWAHAEPGVLFIDTINKKNNLHYCEVIASTNPCGCRL
jgi:ribonucleoside-diphosphate reductase alpha chain